MLVTIIKYSVGLLIVGLIVDITVGVDGFYLRVVKIKSLKHPQLIEFSAP